MFDDVYGAKAEAFKYGSLGLEDVAVAGLDDG